MKVSVAVTVLNEEKTVANLLKALLTQSKKPDEIVIVDAGSRDKTRLIIRHFQKKDKRIKLLWKKGCSRAEGRNLGVEVARSEVIAMTDAGCIPQKHWLKRITSPFKVNQVGAVAGFYKMTGDSPVQQAFSVFLGTLPDDFDIKFLPSTRSIAFRKSVWQEVGGFDENLDDTAEDTIFNHKLTKNGVKLARVKTARVEWGMPETLEAGIKKMHDYAKGDAKSKLWFHSGKLFASHNIRILLIFARYIFGLWLITKAITAPLLWSLALIFFVIYLLFAFRKVYLRFRSFEVGLWGIAIQFISDIAVMSGFIKGLIHKKGS